MQYGRGGLLQSGRYAGLFTLKVMSTVRGRSIGIRAAKTQSSSPAISVSISSGRRLPPAGQRSRRSNEGRVYQYGVSSDLDLSSRDVVFFCSLRDVWSYGSRYNHAGRHHYISASRIADSCKSEHTQWSVFCSTNTRKLQNQLALLTCSEKDWKVDRATMASLA